MMPNSGIASSIASDGASSTQAGRVVVFFGTEHGVGKTVVSAKTAMSLVHHQKQSVCLVDLCVSGDGQLARVLDVRPTRSLVDLLPVLRRGTPPTPQDLQRLVVPHNSGIDVLLGAMQSRGLAQLDAKALAMIFNVLRTRYDLILVDAGRAFSDVLLAAFESADLLVLVTSPHTMSSYHTMWTLSALEGMGFARDMVKVILNRAEPATALTYPLYPHDVIGVLSLDTRWSLETFHRIAAVLRDATPSPRRMNAGNGHQPTPVRLPVIRRLEVDQRVPDAESTDEISQMKRRIQTQLLEAPDFKAPELATITTDQHWRELREKAERMIAGLVAREAGEGFSSPTVRDQLVKEIADDALGLGPLEDLLADPEVTDILVNGKDQVFVERNGRLRLTAKQFNSSNHLRTVIERILAPVGRRIDESAPMVDARLPDGSRINAVIPPLSLRGPVLSIRKFGQVRYGKDDLIGMGTLTPEMAKFLEACVLLRKNIIISGGAGSGKTTLLNMLLASIPPDQRILTIEDAAEFRLSHPHWVNLEARLRNIEGKGLITIRDLFRNALHMRADRIIIGECRGAEALDMLQAMNTGHDGSMTTIHANSPRDVVARLDSMVLMSDIELPQRAIREMVTSAVHILIHTARHSDGSRKITAICELTGVGPDREITFQDLFVFKQTGVEPDGTVSGAYQPTGHKPTFWPELSAKGIALDESIFIERAPSKGPSA